MRGWWRWTAGFGIVSVVGATALGAQSPPAAGGSSGVDVCSLASGAEFQQAHGIHPQIGILPDEPVLTQMKWGPHCDYAGGSIDLFTQSSELERVLELVKAIDQRDPIQGLGESAFFTIVYPDDKYRRRGFLAISLGSRVLALSMDPFGEEPVAATRPRLEKLAKVVLPRLK